jgi:hypothetical protein
VIVVVGGQTRNAGKTTVVCDIIRAIPDARWIAIKISRHGHGADLDRPVVFEETQAGTTDTGRYLAAGAHRAFWLRAKPEDTAEALAAVPSGNWIVESNSSGLAADVTVLVISPESSDWKPSARGLAPDITITAGQSATAITLVQAAL